MLLRMHRVPERRDYLAGESVVQRIHSERVGVLEKFLVCQFDDDLPLLQHSAHTHD